MSRGTETQFELTTIERLEGLGYAHAFGYDLARERSEVVLADRLQANLTRRYPDLSPEELAEAMATIMRPAGADTLRRNMAFHLLAVQGFEQRHRRPGGAERYLHVSPIDWEHPLENDFLVVNQLPVSGANDRRPDLVIFINGLPLVLFELKNPYAQKPTVTDALNQIKHYRHHISALFEFNALCVISDGVDTLHGMWTADMEWFAPWKSIDGREVAPGTIGSMKTLIEGLFPKARLLDYLRHFILFEVVHDRITKKGAKYHQFFAARIAAARTLSTAKTEGDRRIGVIWHTTGSGKSLSMLFLIGLLRRAQELRNPTFVIEVDRTDLDDQLHDQFVAAASLIGTVQQAESTEGLRTLLRTEGGGIIFTTIEKFRLTEGELAHPVLTERKNIIVIADEAHRTQYGFLKGYARYLAEALPNALRLGFTGTPINFSGADTIEVFGEVIHTYDIRQAQDDRATVPIFYEPRQIKLACSRTDLDQALQEIIDGASVGDLERRMSKWAALAELAGTKERLDELAADLLTHYATRCAALDGKAMVVCMTRANCVRLYEAMTALPGCPEVKVVMTGDLAKDPEAWSQAGHLTTKEQRERIKTRLRDLNDPLKIVIVCDMWLTGTDIPCLHTLYVDKPMKGHNIIQAISRLNRVFRDKPHGLVVDFIGIGDELREATRRYTRGGGTGDPAPDINEAAVTLFLAAREELLQLLPAGIMWGDWRSLGNIAYEDRCMLAYGRLTESDDQRDEFLTAEQRLSQAFTLVRHLDSCRGYADELIYFQQIRKQLLKTKPQTTRDGEELARAVRDLVDTAMESRGVVDIFQAAGLPRADLSILDDSFLQTFKDEPIENLRLKLLEKLLRDELTACRAQNPTTARSFQELLEATLHKYHNRLLSAADVIRIMIEIHKKQQAQPARAAAMGLTDDELAFYDALSRMSATLGDQQVLCALIHDIVAAVKSRLKTDWTQPHRTDVQAEVRSAVKQVLRQRKVSAAHFEALVGEVETLAKTLYADWPLAA
jgi:type I restriction enzyme R subunit